MLSVILSVWDASPKPKLLNGRVFPEKKTELHKYRENGHSAPLTSAILPYKNPLIIHLCG